MENSHKSLVLLRQIIRSTDIQDKEISRRTGLTPPQLMLMQTLLGNLRLTSGEIAKEMVLTQATVTSILDRLEKKFLIARIRCTVDKRKVWVSLTQDGVELMKGSPTRQQDLFVRHFEDIQKREQTSIVASLERIAFMLNEHNLSTAVDSEIDLAERKQNKHSKN